jgi:hypothetical protein
MFEVLFVLTIVFVAYVVYTVVNDQKAATKSAVHVAEPATPAVAVEQTKVEAVANVEKPTAVKPAAAKKTAATVATQEASKGELRNPKTGEVASTLSNYRFTKRWIKEALVEEGLVEKVYKNNELDEAVEEKIKDALLKLEAMDKYKA